MPIVAAVSLALSGDATWAQAFDPASPQVLNAYVAPSSSQKTEAARGGLNLLLPRVAGFPDLLRPGNTFVSSGFISVTGNFGFGNLVVIGVTPGGGFSQSFDAASDADLTPLGNPVVLDNALLRATASFSTGRDVVVGPNPAGIDTQQFDLTLTGNLTANAELNKFGNGTLTLGGSTFWMAAPFVQAGTLRASADSLRTDIDNNGTVDFLQSVNGTYTHQISGMGNVRKSGAATLKFTSEQRYGGTTFVDQGTLALEGAGHLGAGDVVIGAGATLDFSAVGGRRLIGALSGSGTLVLGAHPLETTIPFGVNATFAGSITGTGAFGKDGGGTLALTGTSSHTGGTSILGGTLSLVGSGALSSIGSVTINDAARFDIASANGARTIGSLHGAGTVTLGSNDLTIGADNSDSGYGGTLQGTGTLTKTGTGTLQLTGPTLHAGRTVIAQGTLLTRASSVGAEIVNQGTLVFLEERSNPTSPTPPAGTLYETYPELHVHTGTISGTGALIKRGSGALWLRGTHTYSGGTVVEDGVLVGNDASLQGSIANHAGVAFYMSSDGSYAGTMSGSGLLLKYGPGNLVLSGLNTYTGGTGFSGMLTIGDDRNLGGPDAAVIVDGGTLRITADIVSPRRFGLSAEGAAFDTQAYDMTIDGIVSGPGSLTKLGTGRLRLTAANTYTGSTSVQSGTLQVDGAIAGNVTVGSGARIAGRGSIQGAVTLAPGSGLVVEVDASGSIAPLRVGSALIQNAQVFVDATSSVPTRSHGAILSAADVIAGQFSGTSTNAAFLTPSLTYDARNVYLTLVRNDVPLQAVANTRTQFGVATSLDRMIRSGNPDAAIVASFVESLTGDTARSAFDSMAGVGRAALEAVQRTNTRSVIQQASARLGLAESSHDVVPPLRALDRVKLAFESTTPNDAAAVYAQGAAPTVHDLDSSFEHGLWARGYGGTGRVDGTAAGSGADFSVSGVLAGYDRDLGESTRAGVLFAYATPRLTQGAPVGDSLARIHQLALYGRHRSGSLRIDAVAGYAKSNVQASRTIVVGALARRAQADYGGHAQTAAVEGAGALRIGIDTMLEPVVALTWSRQRYDAFTETGAGALNLTQSARTTTSLQSSLGARMIRTWQVGDSVQQAEIRGAWLHEFRSPAHSEVGLAGDISGTTIEVPALAMPSDSAAIGIGLSTSAGRKWSAYVDLTTERNNRQHVNMASAGVRLRW